MNASEVLDFLLPQWSDPLQVVFLTLILTMMILTIATTHWYASQSSWEKKWNGNTPNDHTDDLDIDHGSVTDIWNAVATSPEKLAEIMPGLLLVVGLLGTFLGLGLALNHASHILGQSNALSASGAASSMQDLLGLLQGLGTKFKTSTWGITGFLLLKVWSSVTRFEEKRLTWVIRKVKKELEARKQQAHDAEKAKQDADVAKQSALLGQIERAAGLIVQSFIKQVGDLKEHDKLLSAELREHDKSLHKHSIHYLEKNAQSIRENLIEISNATQAGTVSMKWLIEKNVQDVRDDLNNINAGINSRNTELKDFLAESVNGLSKGLIEIHAATQIGSNALHQQIEQSVQGVRDDLADIHVTAKTGDIEMATLLKQGFDGLHQGLGEINEATNKNSDAMRDLFDRSTKDIRGDLNLIHSATESSREAMQHFVSSTQNIMNGMSEAGVSMSKGANEIGQAAIGMNDGASKIGKAANELVGAVGDFKNEFTAVLHSIHTDLGSAINGMSEKASETLKNGSQELKNATTGISDALGKLAENMQKTMDDLQMSIENSEKSQKEITDKFDKTSNAIAFSLAANTGVVEKLGTNIEEGLKSVANSNRQIIKALNIIEKITPQMMNLECLPSALQPLVELPSQHQSLLNEIKSMREALENRDTDSSEIQRRDADTILRSTDFLVQSIQKFNEFIQEFGSGVLDSLDAVSASNQKIEKIGVSLGRIVPEMQALGYLPSALQPLIQLPEQQLALLNEINSIRQDFIARQSNFQFIENIGTDVSNGLKSVLDSNLQITEIRNSIAAIAPEIRKLLPALQSLHPLHPQAHTAPVIQAPIQPQQSVQSQINTEASALP